MIELRDVSKSYGRVHAVRGVSFSVPRGRVVGLLGANGAGKTSTIRMITGYMPPDSGSVRVNGVDTLEDAQAARQSVGYLPESAPAYGEMAVEDFLDFRGSLYGMARSGRRRAIQHWMTRCWLTDVRRRRIGELSKGFRQRVGLAAALLHDPPLVVLDEPTNGLDPTQIREMRALVRELGATKTVLVSSHILPEVERTCDRVIILARGRIVVDAEPAQLIESLRESSPYVIEVRRLGGIDSAALFGRVGGVESAVRESVEVEPGWERVTVRGEPGAGDLRAALAEAATTAGLTIRELRREAPTLERVFIELFDNEDHSGPRLAPVSQPVQEAAQ